MSRVYFIAVALVIVAVDQFVKHLIITKMYLGQSMPLINDWIHITFIYNNGAAFSLLKDRTGLLLSMATLAVLAIIYFYPKLAVHGKFMQGGLALLMGGTIGNMVDRILTGSVVDFIDFRIWPIFNIADCAICVGAASIAWMLLKSEQGETNCHKTSK